MGNTNRGFVVLISVNRRESDHEDCLSPSPSVRKPSFLNHSLDDAGHSRPACCHSVLPGRIAC